MGLSQKVVIADQELSIDAPHGFVNFREGKLFDSSSTALNRSVGVPDRPVPDSTRRSRPRNLPEQTLAATRAYIKQFVVHLDGCGSADDCFAVLQNERALSVHFLLDNDGTIYQTLDLAHCAFHANGMNETSIGIEICNRGEAKDNESFYSRRGMARNVVTVNIQGDTILSFDFTKEQRESMVALGKFIARALPGIALDYPNSAGSPILKMLYPTDPRNTQLRSYSGYLGHYHTNIQKWDPGPFDFHDFLTRVRGSRMFPVGVHGKTEIPKDVDALDAAMKELYAENETSEEGGYFPVGAFDRYRLWHGGVHLHRPAGEPVVAPWPGYVVAARNGKPSDEIGSTNFVLLKHRVRLSETPLEFYSLYMHLAQEVGAKNRPAWMTPDFLAVDPGNLFVFPTPQLVQAGDVLGGFGLAGPDLEPQLHFEIFATSIGALDELDPEKRWTLVDGSGGGRFCDLPQIIDPIDRNHDHEISAAEAKDFFGDAGNAARDAMHWLVVSHTSEWWGGTPDWATSLNALPGARKLDVDRLVGDQIEPSIWWTPGTARALGLLTDGVVYGFHPLTFVKWLNEKLDAQKSEPAARAATAADIANAKHTKLLQDGDDVTGASALVL
jgi:murein DD-endopeptidase MepM/ murein hydrolase activator NlpD